MYLDTVVATNITQLVIASFSSLIIEIYCILKNLFVRKACFHAQLKYWFELLYEPWEGKQMLTCNSPQFCIYSIFTQRASLWTNCGKDTYIAKLPTISVFTGLANAAKTFICM